MEYRLSPHIGHGENINMDVEDEPQAVVMVKIPFGVPQDIKKHVPSGKMTGGTTRIDTYGCHRLYGAKNNETVKQIANKFDINALLILQTNEPRIEGLELSSKLRIGTILALPIRADKPLVDIPTMCRIAGKQKIRASRTTKTTLLGTGTTQPSSKRRRTSVAPIAPPPRESLSRTSKRNAASLKLKNQKEKATKKQKVKSSAERSSIGGSATTTTVVPVVKSREMVLAEILNTLSKDKGNAAPQTEEDPLEGVEPLTQLEQVQLASLTLLQKMKSILNGLAPDDAFGSEFAEEEKCTMQIFLPNDSKAERIKRGIQYQWQQANAKPKSKKVRRPEFFVNLAQFQDENLKWLADLDWETIVNFYLHCEQNKTPFPFDMVEVRQIDDCDPRVKLRGQNGLFAKHGVHIQEGTVIGPYVALVQFTDEQHHVVGSIAEFLESERYSYEFPVVDMSTLEEFSHLDEIDYPKLFGNGHAAGNMIRAANDFRFDPFGKPRGCTEDGRKNCAFVECYHKGWPYVFVVTTATIKGGQELLLDYSESYWDASVLNVNVDQFRTECTNADCGLQIIHQKLVELQQ